MYKLKISLLVILCLITNVAIATTPKDTLVVAHKIDDAISLDPATMFEVSSSEYVANTYEQLVKYDLTDNKIYGEIAKDWHITANGKIYTFIIHNNRKFASGNPITAEDVAFSLQRIILLNKSPAYIFTQFGFNKKNVTKRIKAIDDVTVKIMLKEPFSPSFFLNCLTSPTAAIIEKKLVMQHQVKEDLGNKWLNTHHAGSGSFQLVKWQPNELLSLKRNPYSNKQPAIRKIIVRHVSESATQKLLLEQGDVDIARNLHSTNLHQLAKQIYLKSAPFYLQSFPKGSLIYLSLNQKNRYLKHPEVCQAIKYLINYQEIKSSLLSYEVKVHQSFIPDGFFGATNKHPFSFDLEKAKALLKKVGLEKGFTITLDANRPRIAQAIQASLAKANIKVKIISGDGKQVITKFRERKHEMLLVLWGADYLDPHSNAGAFTYNPDNSERSKDKNIAWRTSWHIPELTKKTILAVKELDNKKREQMYYDIQQEFFATSPLIVLFQHMEVSAINKNVRGFKLGPTSNFTSYADIKKSS